MQTKETYRAKRVIDPRPEKGFLMACYFINWYTTEGVIVQGDVKPSDRMYFIKMYIEASQMGTHAAFGRQANRVVEFCYAS